MKSNRIRVAGSVVAVSVLTGVATAQVPTILPDQTRTLSGAGEIADFFGDHVASWGPWLFVAAPRERDLACQYMDAGLCDDESDGAVYVYRLRASGNYELTQRIGPREVATTPSGDRFGAGLAAANGMLLVGVANDPAGAGEFAGGIDFYKLDASGQRWAWTGQTLHSPTPIAFGAFGARTHAQHFVLGEGARIAVVGESAGNAGGLNARLHVFRRNLNQSWELVQTVLPPPDPRGDTRTFADKLVELPVRHYVVSKALVSGDCSIACTYIEQLHVYGPGSPEPTLNPVPLQTIDVMTVTIGPDDSFPASGLTYAQGRLYFANSQVEVDGVPAAGAVYVYRFQPGLSQPLELESIIPNPDPTGPGGFGINFPDGAQAMAARGPWLLVGRSARPGQDPDDGDVCLFRQTSSGFQLAARLRKPPSEFLFGHSVWFIGQYAVVGQPFEPAAGGRLLFYELPSGNTQGN